MLPENVSTGRDLRPIPTGLDPVIPAIETVRAILFDVYGTLFISGSGDISLAQSRDLKQTDLAVLLRNFKINRSPDSLQAHFFDAINASHAESVKNGNNYPEVEIDKIWQKVTGLNNMLLIRKFAIEYELLVNPVAPMPHLNELLAACRKTSITTGIISNAQFFTPLLFTWFLDATPVHLGFNPRLLFYSWEWGMAKPSPALFQAAADRLSGMGIKPNETIYIGNDMRNDMLPAAATGFRTALFAGDKRSLRLRRGDARCTDFIPDMTITDLIQLADYINIR